MCLCSYLCEHVCAQVICVHGYTNMYSLSVDIYVRVCVCMWLLIHPSFLPLHYFIDPYQEIFRQYSWASNIGLFLFNSFFFTIQSANSFEDISFQDHLRCDLEHRKVFHAHQLDISELCIQHTSLVIQIRRSIPFSLFRIFSRGIGVFCNSVLSEEERVRFFIFFFLLAGSRSQQLMTMLFWCICHFLSALIMQ